MLEHLWAGIGGGHATERARIEHSRVRIVSRLLEDARDAEIDHLHFAAIGEEDIGGLEVAVDEATLVRIGQGPAHAGDDRQRLGVRHADKVRCAQDAIERLAGQVLHGQVHHRAVAVEVIDRHDIAMRQRLRLARLTLQRDQRFRMTAELHIEDLDGDVGLAVRGLELAQVECLVDRSHAAHAQALLQHEAAIQGVAHPFGLLRPGNRLVGRRRRRRGRR